MKKRILSTLLLLSMLASLAACGGDGDKDKDKDKDKSNNTDAEYAGIAAADYNLPFTIYAPEWGLYEHYFFADDAGTDAMTKALYERELAVEEHLGVDIGYTLEGRIADVRTKVQECVMTGDDTYQLLLTHCCEGISPMVTENLLYDFKNFEYVDLGAEWWNQQAQEALEVNGKLFYGVSDYMLADPNCILFNKSMIEELKLEDPYKLVRDGEWTIDKMMELMRNATIDNGDNRWDHSDTYGLTTPNDWYCNSFIFSSEVDLISRNSEGEFEFAFDNERTYAMAEKVGQLLNGADTWIYKYYIASYEECIANDEYVDISKGRSLFNVSNVGMLYVFRDIDLDFGVLPFPKLEASQSGYYTNDWSGMMCVPKTVKNEDMVGKVIELLSYFSTDSVRPAYYEIMLGEKLTRDPESKEMLDIIFDGVSFDSGLNYFGFSGMKTTAFYISNQIMKGSTGSSRLASFLAQNQPAAEAELEQFNEDVKNINYDE